MRMLDGPAANQCALLDLVLRCQEKMGVAKGHARGQEHTEIKKGVGDLVHGNRITEPSGEVIIPGSAKVGANLDEWEAQASDFAEDVTAAVGDMVLEWRHGRRGCHEERGAAVHFAEESGLQEAVLAAAKGSGAEASIGEEGKRSRSLAGASGWCWVVLVMNLY
jgi:hypothetical protein